MMTASMNFAGSPANGRQIVFFSPGDFAAGLIDGQDVAGSAHCRGNGPAHGSAAADPAACHQYIGCGSPGFGRKAKTAAATKPDVIPVPEEEDYSRGLWSGRKRSPSRKMDVYLSRTGSGRPSGRSGSGSASPSAGAHR